MLKAVFLDFGNVIINESIFIPAAQMGIVNFVRERAGLSEPISVLYEKLQATPDGVPADDPIRLKPKSRETIRVKKFRNFAVSCGLDLSDTDTAEMMTAYDNAAAESGVINGTVEALQWMRARYKMAIMSNGYSGFVHATLARHDLRKYFDVVNVSEDINAEKPSREFYGHAADALGVNFDEVLMAGDGWIPDIEGAKRLGMTTCWINPERKPQPDLAMCDYDVPRLADLPALLA
jgi:2-haloacid dehalogenase